MSLIEETESEEGLVILLRNERLNRIVANKEKNIMAPVDSRSFSNVLQTYSLKFVRRFKNGDHIYGEAAQLNSIHPFIH